jgi:hypothetical protein
MKQPFLISLIILILFACNSNKEKQSSENSVAPIKTIKILAQWEPGGETSMIDMTIDHGLDALEIVGQQDVELDGDDIVLGLSIDKVQLAIPLRYLSGFEVANLTINEKPYLITWCPLVGAARIFSGSNTGYDFGRGLINDNLLIVDRKTKSVWNQLSCKAVVGELKGEQLDLLPSIQSTWDFWKQKYPETGVAVNSDTTGAAFPSNLFSKPYYHDWIPGTPRPKERRSNHNLVSLGLGVDLGGSQVFFPMLELEKADHPLSYNLNGNDFIVRYDSEGRTAWAENAEGKLIAGSMVYQRSWRKFYPKSRIFPVNN